MQKMMTVATAGAAKDVPKEQIKASVFGKIGGNVSKQMAEEKAYEDAMRPVPATQNVGIGSSDSKGLSNFESELRRKRKKTSTSFAGDTGGYGGNTKLG